MPDALEVALTLALADVAERARVEFPDVFDRVDEVRRRPGWQPFRYVAEMPLQIRTSECAWCGDEFPLSGSYTVTCCSRDCSLEYQAWRRRRAAPKRGAPIPKREATDGRSRSGA